MEKQQLKKKVAYAALNYIPDGILLGIGTGSTINCFIDALMQTQKPIQGAVSSSTATTTLLHQANIPVVPLEMIDTLPIYIDGADEINPQLQMIKGGGGALTQEKIVASCAQKFICIADASKYVETLGKFPLPIEVIPMSWRSISRKLSDLGACVQRREDFITDNGNIILDASGLNLTRAKEIESMINQWPGVVTNGIFAKRSADIAIISQLDGSVKVCLPVESVEHAD